MCVSVAVPALQNGLALSALCVMTTAEMQDGTYAYMARVLMQTGLLLDR